MKYSNKLGQWSYFGAPIGDFGTEYAYRALVAIAGLGANTVEIALYPKTDKDADGNPLTGEKSYLLHFESDPQVLDGGFWSITAYGDDDFLIDNPIDRYCINDRSGLKRNDDGSVDVILSKDAPADTTNWLPVADGGFHLFMRIYTPDMEALKTWTAPTITADRLKGTLFESRPFIDTKAGGERNSPPAFSCLPLLKHRLVSHQSDALSPAQRCSLRIRAYRYFSLRYSASCLVIDRFRWQALMLP